MSYVNLKIGIPHFSGTIVTARNSNYTVNKAILDILDGAISFISKAEGYKLLTTVKIEDNDGKLDKIIFEDNYHLGFENILCQNESNPFNMAHTRAGHGDDTETSEFGRGMKFSAIFLAEEFDVYTRVEDKYYKIGFDFIKMKFSTCSSKTLASQAGRFMDVVRCYDSKPQNSIHTSVLVGDSTAEHFYPGFAKLNKLNNTAGYFATGLPLENNKNYNQIFPLRFVLG